MNKMKCICSEIPEALYYENVPKKLLGNLAEVAIGDWIKLFKCKVCDQHWSIDEYDKFVHRVAVKISDVDNWEENDSEGLRKQLLLEARGGTQGEVCQWSGCKNQRVKDMAICIDHLWETGARK